MTNAGIDLLFRARATIRSPNHSRRHLRLQSGALIAFDMRMRTYDPTGQMSQKLRCWDFINGVPRGCEFSPLIHMSIQYSLPERRPELLRGRSSARGIAIALRT